MMPTTAMACAIASLQAKNLVPERRKIITGIREDTFGMAREEQLPLRSVRVELLHGRHQTASEDVVMAMRAEKVYIGRVWPAWPTHVRVSVGTQEEMNNFKTAFSKVMA